MERLEIRMDNAKKFVQQDTILEVVFSLVQVAMNQMLTMVVFNLCLLLFANPQHSNKAQLVFNSVNPDSGLTPQLELAITAQQIVFHA